MRHNNNQHAGTIEYEPQFSLTCLCLSRTLQYRPNYRKKHTSEGTERPGNLIAPVRGGLLLLITLVSWRVSEILETSGHPHMIYMFIRLPRLHKTSPQTVRMTEISVKVIRIETRRTAPGGFPNSCNLGTKSVSKSYQVTGRDIETPTAKGSTIFPLVQKTPIRNLGAMIPVDEGRRPWISTELRNRFEQRTNPGYDR